MNDLSNKDIAIFLPSHRLADYRDVEVGLDSHVDFGRHCPDKYFEARFQWIDQNRVHSTADDAFLMVCIPAEAFPEAKTEALQTIAREVFDAAVARCRRS